MSQGLHSLHAVFVLRQNLHGIAAELHICQGSGELCAPCLFQSESHGIGHELVKFFRGAVRRTESIEA